MQEYSIEHTWDGLPLAAAKKVSIHLNIQPTFASIRCRAPYYNNSAPQGPSGSLWKLWEHEVVEVFLVGENGTYTEIEFGPHGHYLILRLDGPRSIIDHGHTIEYSARIEEDIWFGTAIISTALLPTNIERINCFAIHGEAEDRTYLCHSPLPHSHPDFHQPHRFPKLHTEVKL